MPITIEPRKVRLMELICNIVAIRQSLRTMEHTRYVYLGIVSMEVRGAVVPHASHSALFQDPFLTRYNSFVTKLRCLQFFREQSLRDISNI